MKRYIKTLMILSLSLLQTTQPESMASDTINANEVMKRWDNRNDGNTELSKSAMILIDNNNSKRTRQLKSYRKDFGNDKKMIIFFLDPADVRGTSYLSYEWEQTGKDDDNWLYLPSLRKVRRIPSTDKSGSFMGSDFSYSDISGFEIDYWDYSFLKQNEKYNGNDTWVIVGLPKKKYLNKVIDETGYLKTKLWIRKDNYMIVKGKYWVKKGRKIKYYMASNIKKVNGIWTAMSLQMTTTQGGVKEHVTVIKVLNIKYNTPIQNKIFTVQRMERGI